MRPRRLASGYWKIREAHSMSSAVSSECQQVGSWEPSEEGCTPEDGPTVPPAGWGTESHPLWPMGKFHHQTN
jgi:hypothetical protein